MEILVLTCFPFSAVDISAIKAGQDAKPRKTRMGRCLGDTIIQFEKAENSSLNLVGKAKGYVGIILTFTHLLRIEL